jgi:HK97 gp10 family phage protein
LEFTVEISGLKELEDTLADLGPQLAKKALRKALKAAAEPLVEAAKAKAPVLAEGTPQRRPGELRDSIGVQIKFDEKNQQAVAHIGPDKKIYWSPMVEYGSVHNPTPVPFMRSSFDGSGKEALEKFTETMREIIPTLERKT